MSRSAVSHASRIGLRLGVEVESELKAPAGMSTTSVWTLTVWMGDPVASAMLRKKFATELGTGPVGAAVLLFGNVVSDPEGPRLEIFDGLVEDGSGSARMALVEDAEPKELATIEAAVASLDRGAG